MLSATRLALNPHDAGETAVPPRNTIKMSVKVQHQRGYQQTVVNHRRKATAESRGRAW